jgi:hypothetical protein
LGERIVRNDEVSGSIPLSSTMPISTTMHRETTLFRSGATRWSIGWRDAGLRLLGIRTLQL